MATDLSSLIVTARVGMPLLIQPVQVLDKVRGRLGAEQYVVRILTSGDIYGQVHLIDPKDLIKAEDPVQEPAKMQAEQAKAPVKQAHKKEDKD